MSITIPRVECRTTDQGVDKEVVMVSLAFRRSPARQVQQWNYRDQASLTLRSDCMYSGRLQPDNRIQLAISR